MELGFKQPGPMPMCCDNQSAIYITQNLVFHEKTKHIEIDCHFVRDAWTKKVITFQFTPSSKQLDDLLTKATSPQCFLTYVTSQACQISILQLESVKISQLLVLSHWVVTYITIYTPCLLYISCTFSYVIQYNLLQGFCFSTVQTRFYVHYSISDSRH